MKFYTVKTQLLGKSSLLKRSSTGILLVVFGEVWDRFDFLAGSASFAFVYLFIYA